MAFQSGKRGTIRASNQASDVRKGHYAQYYVRKSSILLTGTGVREISSAACWFSSVKIHYSVNRINEVYVVLIKYRYSNGKVTTSQLDFTNESQEVSPFPAGDHKASINRRARKHNKTKLK